MNFIIKNFIANGIYNNKLFFPDTEKGIENFVAYNYPVISAVRKEDADMVFMYLRNNLPSGNIYIASLIIAGLDKYDPVYMEYLCFNTNNKYDLFVVLHILSSAKCKFRTKYLNEILAEKPYLFEGAHEYFKQHILLSPKNKVMLNKRYGIITKIQEKLASGTFSVSELELIQEHNIHFNEIGYYLSYTFAPMLKHDLFCYFLNKFDIGDIICCIDKAFIRDISPDLLLMVSQKLQTEGTLEDYIYLMLYYKNMANYSLREMVLELIKAIDYKALLPNCQSTFENVRVFPHPSYTVFMDKSDRVPYLHGVAVFAALISEIYNKPLYIKNNLITGSLMDKIDAINHCPQIIDYTAEEITASAQDCVFAVNTNTGSIIWDVTCNSPKPDNAMSIYGFNLKLFEVIFETSFCTRKVKSND